VENPVTLKMIYEEVKKVNQRLDLIEDIIEEVLIKVLPETELEQEKIEEIKKSIDEMKKGDFVALEELKSA
jgi:tetrahydromethanopterin S-methyltransferase subunit G